MTVYRYTAVTSEQELTSGTHEAASEGEVAEHLTARGHVPLTVEPQLAVGGLRALLSTEISLRRGLSGRERVALTREVHLLLDAGLELEPALDMLSALSGNSRAGRTLLKLLTDVRGGLSFADALARQADSFPPSYVALVRAGEASGTLPTILTRLADMAERNMRVRSEVQAALIYPAFLCFAAVVSIGVLLVVVVPSFRPIFEESGAELPFSTQLAVGAADFLQAYGLSLLGALAVLALVLRQQLRRDGPRNAVDRLVLALPVAGNLVRNLETTRFARTMGALLSGGVPVGRALALAKEVLTNRAFAQTVSASVDLAGSGMPLSQALAREQRFPELAVRLWHVGEKTGRLDQMFEQVGAIYDAESRQTLKKLLALLVPVLTIVMGAMTAFIIYSILAAVLSINALAV